MLLLLFSSVSVMLAAQHAVLLLCDLRSYARYEMGRNARAGRYEMSALLDLAPQATFTGAASIGATSASICTTPFAATRTPTEPVMKTAVTVSVDTAVVRRDANITYQHIIFATGRMSTIGQMLYQCRMSAATVAIGRM